MRGPQVGGDAAAEAAGCALWALNVAAFAADEECECPSLWLNSESVADIRVSGLRRRRGMRVSESVAEFRVSG